MGAHSPSADAVDRFRADLDALAPGNAPRLGVAVSGGPDSMALLLLASAAFPGRVHAATVDHGLRAESAAEAALARSHCERLGVPHAILKVAVADEGEGMQAAARRARYVALAGWMKESGIGILLTGHHEDDQAETLLMRLLRGSGVAGLAGIRAIQPLPTAGEGALLLRPLLEWPREELAAIVAAAGIEAVDDPSNGDEAYDRARLRRRMAETPWLDPVPLARSAAALAEAEAALQATAERLFKERAERQGQALLLRPDDVPAELLRRLVKRCLGEACPPAAPRGEQVGSLIASLSAGGTATLAGVKCSGGAVWRFEPEGPRIR